MQSLAKLVSAKNFWQVNHARPLLPFPGRYPTRWRISVWINQGSKAEFDVVTKPNLPHIQKILRRAKKPGLISLIEFDRSGAIRIAQKECPTTRFELYDLSPWTSIYYPWHSAGTGFFDPWYKKVFHKRMKLGKRTFYVYSPHEKMLGDIQGEKRLRDYRTWLNKQKLWKK